MVKLLALCVPRLSSGVRRVPAWGDSAIQLAKSEQYGQAAHAVCPVGPFFHADGDEVLVGVLSGASPLPMATLNSFLREAVKDAGASY